MNLYNLSNQYQLLLENIHDEFGVINESALQQIEQHNDLINNKCIAISSYIKNLIAEENAIKQAENEMYERRKITEKKILHLQEYLKSNMERCQINEIKCPQFIIKIKKNPLAVNVFSPEILPEKYYRLVTEKKIDKKLIKECIDNGEHVPGAMMQQNTRIEIK